jgi:phosphate/sulfate permease
MRLTPQKRAFFYLYTQASANTGAFARLPTRRLSAVRWGVAGNIVFAWVLTMPATAIVAGICYWSVQAIF